VEIEIWEPKIPRDFGKIIQMTYSPESYYAMSNKDICTSLHKGFLLRENKVWFSLGTDGRRVEVISATEFHFKSYFGPDKWIPTQESRFGQVAWIADSSMMYLQFKIKAHLLSPGVNYGVNLLFKFSDPRKKSITSMDLEYHIGNKFLRSHCTTKRDDGWLMKELFQFSSLAEEADIDVFLLGLSGSHYVNQVVYIEGIEFRAINNASLHSHSIFVLSFINLMTHEEMEELKRVSTANVQQSPTDKGHWKVNMAERSKEGGMFKRLGSREKSVSARSDNYSRNSHSKYTEALSESEDSEGGHRKSRSKKKKSYRKEDNLSQPWVCEEVDPFTPRIRYFDFPKTGMPSHIKTYDGSEDPEDHLKISKQQQK
ncbi:reverse transcriptase domain-containing protein, partial [Tanacetum coccineum]